MQDTKLIRALSTLNKEEWMSFRKFVISKTGQDSEIYSLFTKLHTKKSNFQSLGSLGDFRSKHFKHLSQQAFLSMVSKLYKWLEQWLIIFELENDEIEKQLYLIKALFRKGLNKEGQSQARKLENKVTAKKGLSFISSKIRAEINNEIYFGGTSNTVEERHEMLKLICKNRILQFSEEMQFLKAEIYNREKIYRKDFNEIKNLIEQTTAFIPKNKIAEFGQLLQKTIKDEDPESLDQIQRAIINEEFMPNSKLESMVFAYAAINTRKLLHQNDIKDLDLSFQVLNMNLQRGIEKSEGGLTHISFHNMVDTIANLFSIDKAHQFMNRWIDAVETKAREETLKLAQSQIYFVERNFEEMKKYCGYISFDNYGQRTRAWLHIIICQFQSRKEDYDLVMQSLASFKSYLKRNKRKYSKNYYLSNNNAATILQKLVKNDFKPQKIELQDYKYLFYRKWITEEVEKAKKQ